MPNSKNRYAQIIEAIFSENFRQGTTEITFERTDIARVAKRLRIRLPKNLGDILYSFRYRSQLPDRIAAKAPQGYEWIIRPAGRARYKLVLIRKTIIAPSSLLVETKIPDATPGIITRYSLNDEQALLAKIRYNGLIDIFTGLTCYSLQNHLRTTAPNMGQVETDEIYIGLDKRGVHYVLPVQAKGGTDRIGIVQIEQDLAVCAEKFSGLICRPIAAQFMNNDKIADTRLLNANIHTLDSQRPHATALAVRDGKILAVGSDYDIRAHTPTHPHTEKLDLHGLTVLPGLTDAHLHFEWYSFGLQAVDAETDSLAECLRRVEAKARTTPEGGWVTGYGWNHNVWGGEFPSAADLDRAALAHPIFLQAKSGHAGWANSLALKRAGITAGTADPAGGLIQRDRNGEPTGILLEDAMELVERVIPARTAAELAEAMHPALENAWRAGLTGIHDFDGRKCFTAFQMLKERGQLGLRVVKQIRVAYLDHAIRLGLRSGFGDDWLRLGNVKVFLDGALGPRTARMIEPYEGEPPSGNFGIVVTDKEELYEHAAKAAANGLAMTVHAIGDKANHDLLDVYETIRGEEMSRGPQRLRHRCEHVQILHPDDFKRLGQLNLVASMQPIHATSDMHMADRDWGARRNRGAYAWRTQLDAGAVLAFGSDAPVESLNPFRGIHAAVTRRRADGSPGPEGWFPEQRLTVKEAVRGFTLGAAYAGYMETKLGSLAPGKLADLIVIDRDIFACNPIDIEDTQVLGTMIGGEWKYRTF